MSVIDQEYVILLHGLARTPASFTKMALSLEKEGYYVINDGYPSTTKPIEELSEVYISKVLSKCRSKAKIHFVTHSMGGILLRYYLSKNTIENLGSVVMLGPPNQGSQVVDKLRGLSLFRWINGPAGLQLGTKDNSLLAKLPPVDFTLGIISGTRSINLFLSMLLPGRNDGKVSIENTKVQGMTEHIILPVTHSFMMQNNGVIKKVIHFLKHKSFS